MQNDDSLIRAINTFLVSAVAFTLMLGTIAPCISLAQEPTWVTVKGEAPLKTGEQDSARQFAIAAAERNAIIQVLATDVTVDTLLVNLRLSGSIIRAIPYGKVIRTKILEEGPASIPEGADTGNGEIYRVRIKAAVQRLFDKNDTSLQLEAGLNQTLFNDGDPLEIRIQSALPCYFAIFNILEGNTIVQLLPNNLSRDNRLAAGTQYIFPGKKEQKKNITLHVHLPEDKRAVTESIYILALPQPFELSSLEVQQHAFGIFKGRRTFMQDVIRAVVTTPFSQRAEKLIQYEIRKPAKRK